MKKVMYNNSELSGSFGQENTPVGTILAFGGTNLPFGYMWCNGSAVSRTIYAELFNAIGTAFGSGDGSTTFNLPTNHSTSPTKDIIKFCKAISPSQEQFIDDNIVSAEKTWSSNKINNLTQPTEVIYLKSAVQIPDYSSPLTFVQIYADISDIVDDYDILSVSCTEFTGTHSKGVVDSVVGIFTDIDEIVVTEGIPPVEVDRFPAVIGTGFGKIGAVQPSRKDIYFRLVVRPK